MTADPGEMDVAMVHTLTVRGSLPARIGAWDAPLQSAAAIDSLVDGSKSATCPADVHQARTGHAVGDGDIILRE